MCLSYVPDPRPVQDPDLATYEALVAPLLGERNDRPERCGARRDVLGHAWGTLGIISDIGHVGPSLAEQRMLFRVLLTKMLVYAATAATFSVICAVAFRFDREQWLAFVGILVMGWFAVRFRSVAQRTAQIA